MKYLLISILLLGMCGCAGQGKIWEYEADQDHALRLKKVTVFEGKGIRCKTSDGAEMETKAMDLPTVPFKYEN